MSRSRMFIAVALIAIAGTVVVVSRAGGSAPPPYDSYAVKFTCGEFGKSIPPTAADNPEGPVKPGDYQTVINIHNPAASVAVTFFKKAVLLYKGTAPVNETQHEIAV